jgi:cell division protein FtsA
MTKKQDRELVVGLDIGTSKVVAIVAEVSPDASIDIIGLGSHPSRGLKRGVVVNIESTVQSIQRAVEEAELMAGCEIHSVFTGIAGSHIRSFNSNGVVPIRDVEVTVYDVERVIEAAKAVAIPADQKVIHILPQEFIIDEQDGIREPIGMSGVRLEAKVHMVSGAASAAQNIIKCIRKCHLEVDDIILEQLASACVLTEDEKELGVCLIDIGGGTTDIAVFSEGAIRHTAVIPIAGDQVTSDIAVALRTPSQSAEAIKTKYGTVDIQRDPPEHVLEVPNASEHAAVRQVSSMGLAEVIQARYEELFNLVRLELERSGFADLVPAGVVLTGGASRVDGVMPLAESIFDLPVRIGFPRGIEGLAEIKDNPAYATGVGLILHGMQQRRNQQQRFFNEGFKGVMHRMRTWFQGHF